MCMTTRLGADASRHESNTGTDTAQRLNELNARRPGCLFRCLRASAMRWREVFTPKQSHPNPQFTICIYHSIPIPTVRGSQRLSGPPEGNTTEGNTTGGNCPACVAGMQVRRGAAGPWGQSHGARYDQQAPPRIGFAPSPLPSPSPLAPLAWPSVLDYSQAQPTT